MGSFGHVNENFGSNESGEITEDVGDDFFLEQDLFYA